MVLESKIDNTVTVSVWIPLRRYELTLRHKLLTQLGEISHFILKALLQYPLTLKDFELITQLSEKQLGPVMARLKGLGLIDWQGQLTPNYGKPIAYILENLHQKSIQLWLDQRYHSERKRMLMFKGDSTVIKLIPEEAIKIELKSLEWDWSADCFNQSERLRRSIQTVLPWLFPAFKELPNLEKMKWGQEWELELHIINTEFSKNYGLPIELEFLSQPSEKTVISVFTKVLALETHFELAQGIDFRKSLECPKSIKFQYSFAEKTYRNDLLYDESTPNSNKIFADSDNEEIGIELLKKCHENTDNWHSMFNRLHKFSIGWQKYSADWSQVLKCLPETEDMYKEVKNENN